MIFDDELLATLLVSVVLYYRVFFAVVRMRAEIGELRGVNVDEVAEYYLKGRAASTITAYGPAYKKVAEHGEKVGCSVFCWGPGEAASMVMNMAKLGTSENCIKTVCAVVNLVFEVMGRSSPTQDSFFSKVKAATIKEANEGIKIKSDRQFIEVKHMKIMVEELYKDGVEPARKRFLVMQLFLFFGGKRFSDIKEVKVENVVKQDDGSIKVFVNKSKTDQEGRGACFSISGKKVGKVCVPDIVQWYKESLELSDGDFLFPRFRGSSGKTVPIKSISVSYTAALEQLKVECRRLGLPIFGLHAGRIGMATVAARGGVHRSVIKDAGGWKSDAGDSCIKVDNAGVQVSSLLLSRF